MLADRVVGPVKCADGDDETMEVAPPATPHLFFFAATPQTLTPAMQQSFRLAQPGFPPAS